MLLSSSGLYQSGWTFSLLLGFLWFFGEPLMDNCGLSGEELKLDIGYSWTKPFTFVTLPLVSWTERWMLLWASTLHFLWFLTLMSSVGIDYEDCLPLSGTIISFLMWEVFQDSKAFDETEIQVWVVGKDDYMGVFLAVERVGHLTIQWRTLGCRDRNWNLSFKADEDVHPTGN